MKVSKDVLFAEAENAGIPRRQVDELWDGLSAAFARQRKFDPLQVAYYFGGSIVVMAVTYFFTLAWDLVGGIGIMAMAVTYGCVFAALGRHLYCVRGLSIAGGLLIGVAVCMTPLAMYGLAGTLGWPAMYARLLMGLATVSASAVALRCLRLPFLMTPAACALWYLAIEAVPASQQCWASAAFGLLLMLTAFLVDKRSPQDYSFWLYLFGVSAFWGGISFMDSGGPGARLWYFVVNTLLLVLSTLLDRRVFAVFGSLGVAGYLSYLIFRLFHGSLFLPMALTVIGVGIIIATVACQRNRGRIDAFLAGLLPGELAGVFLRSRQTAR